jgi:threonine/homoserine/homoserine lactone efflux protein
VDQQTLAFAGVAALLVVTPGPDMALVAKNGLAYGRRAALATAFGINAGIVFWTLASAVGLAALVRSSALAFETLRLVGAAYLVFLGIQAFRAKAPVVPGPAEPADRSAFRQGVVSNLLNPKLAVLYTSLLPQFIPSGESVLLRSLMLGGIFNLMGVVWLCFYAVVVAKLGSAIRPHAQRWLDRLTGTVLIGLGLRLAGERR